MSAEQEALTWIRTRLPRNAIVQDEPVARGRETWSLIPSFGERRMATGEAISLMPTPGQHQDTERVRRIYASEDSNREWEEAKALGIDEAAIYAMRK